MILTIEERNKLRSSIENSMHTMSEGVEKRLVMILLALLCDLEEAEQRSMTENSVEASLLFVIKELSTTPLELDAEYIQNFSEMAENLNTLADSVWRLKTLLDNLYFTAAGDGEEHIREVQ